MLERLNYRPDAMTICRQTVEHVFGTLKSWMGPRHFLTKGLKNVITEMRLNVLTYKYQTPHRHQTARYSHQGIINTLAS